MICPVGLYFFHDCKHCICWPSQGKHYPVSLPNITEREVYVCLSVWLSFVYFAFYISIRLHVESLYLFMCGGMMIKCVCLWFCGINGLFTKTVNKRE